ncbi:hypothetical protein DUNSADRAFT_12211 [Dunaliella salina]|uniref:Uncharacterized protein n=1 Tax=Dunaliella salina TaxID=3046 RepID=A0ABQ7GBQ9_DUNSA|nr:hypothetical protein DUNSADRAFT_12211 [Dunaliella salina]|eukprot:KAF5832031.1 hypothetical protein DUNSADRAFT_12211 [Dunaliella salina]
MSGVERHAYMDNQLSSIMTENIQKEKRIQQQYFQDQISKGTIRPKPPTPQPEHKPLLDSVGVPEFVDTTRQDPIQAMNSSISRSLWPSNPGYLERNGAQMASTFKKDFVYDQDEVEYMKSLGYMDKKHNRRKDEFVNYVEAHAKLALTAKGPAGGQ